MGQGHAPGPQRQAARAAPGLGDRDPEQPDPLDHLGQSSQDQPGPDRDARRPPAPSSARTPSSRPARPAGPARAATASRWHRALQIAALPRQQRPGGQDQEGHDHQRREGQGEIGRADRDGRAGRRLQDQRIQGAQQHGRRRRRQEQVVQHQRALAADRGEQAAALQLWARARRTGRRPPRPSRPGWPAASGRARDRRQRHGRWSGRPTAPERPPAWRR